MLFDLSIRGHHPAYIRHLITYWRQHQPRQSLAIVVSPRFLDEHSDVVELVEREEKTKIQFHAITAEEAAHLGKRKSFRQRLLRSFREWDLLLKYIKKLNASYCITLYFDTCMLPAALGKHPACELAGIYFRPTFHYADLNQEHQASIADKLQKIREKVILKLLDKKPNIAKILCLDKFAVADLNKTFKQTHAMALPDPVEIHSGSPEFTNQRIQDMKAALGIDNHRKTFLLFGSLTHRKGIPQVLTALQQLPEDLAKKLCIALVGESNQAESINSNIEIICQQKPVQIVRYYDFVPEADVPIYFALADVVLAPYQKHVGMSGILLLAAAAGKPVLSSDYGLMGELVRRYQLGLTIDSSQPEHIADALTQYLSQPSTTFCNSEKMQEFVLENSADKFAQVVFQDVIVRDKI
ncbi:Glycosyltransferase Type 1 [Halomicronema hongdechloris C2206]|uniref:Glycosyltransferase Type 1 n=1 Tax=Halomicronema hongdechloris C2206 TaxID=1641165 RepID=A0A1Z3HLZ2_9CYAN|nr:glycosyltransferase [Halomicronema hongdechloris]ASC71321.1 Glycosyltransferase Type 1 [Halomicronema hongdechloris C2206]